jgi:Zn-dependent M28 family amino/carboxypeptidase
MRVQVSAVVLTSIVFLACNPSGPASATAEMPTPTAAQAVPAAAQLHIDANRVLQMTKEIVAFGPRFLGSPGHQRALDYLKQHLTHDAVETDSFTAQTPAGPLPITNVLAKFSGTKDGIVVVVSHYDTNYPLRSTKYVGANDGACTSALLLEIANQLRAKKRDGYSVWLVWSDGEEAVKEWTAQDSLYGTRHLAQKWQQDGTAKKIKGLLIADMICDAQLDIARDTNSTPWLVDLVQQAASDLGYQSHFFQTQLATDDDHTPFLKIGVPAADLIDFNYGYNNAFWHTVDDTVDKLSPRSAQISGDTILRTIQLLDARN